MFVIQQNKKAPEFTGAFSMSGQLEIYSTRILFD